MNATIERNVTLRGWDVVDTSTNDARDDIDEQAEREGLAMKRHRRMTAKHRRIVYRRAGIADPRP